MNFIIHMTACFLLSLLVISCLKPIAYKLNLIDIPNDRKDHVGSIPLVGGIAIYLSVLFISLLSLEITKEFQLYIISSSLLLLIGVLDDRFELSVKLRISVQMIISLMMIIIAEYHIHSFGYILGFFEFKLGILGIFITIMAVIGSINAFNMVDGIDGLAGSLSIISFSAIAYLFFHINNEWYFLSLLFIAAITAYLMFNLVFPSRLGKIFMGDAGSMVIGFTIVWLLIIGINNDVNALSPVTALYIIAIPLMDLTTTLMRRIKNGTSPFVADREHLHHLMEYKGFNKKQTLIILSTVSLIINLIGCAGEILQISEWVMFLGFLFIYYIYLKIFPMHKTPTICPLLN